MTALDQKLARSLWHLRGQVLAVAMVVASGVAVLVMSLSTLEALRNTTALYYESYRFADIFASAVRAPERVAARIADLPGVQSVESRISRYASLDIDGFPEPVIGRLVSVPERGQPTLNQLVLRSGRWIEPNGRDEVILNEPFAQAHALEPGDHLVAVINGHRRRLTVVGTALSPEFVYALGPGALMPDDRRFGVLWMGRKELEAAYDLDGAFNDIAIGLMRGVDPTSVIARVDKLLEPYGGSSARPRADQLSNWFVMNEMDQLQTMAKVLPTVFLSVAAFLTYMVLTRLVAVERGEIGLLKAFGYRNVEIVWHYTKLVMAIAAIGVAAGFVLGGFFGLHNTRLYAEFFRFPVLVYRPSPTAFLVAAAVSVGATIGGAFAAVRRAATLPPAEAMRPPAPAVYHHGRLSLGVLRLLDQPTRIAVRQIVRWPLRSALTCAGIALSVGLLVTSLQWNDSIDEMARAYFYDAQHQNVTIGLSQPESMATVEEVKRLPGVLAAEPSRIVAADFSVGTRRHRGAVTGLPQGARLQPIHDDATGKDLPVPGEGLMLASRLATKLGVRVGDRIWVAVLEGRRPAAWIPVVGVFDTTIAMPAYMDLDALNRMLRERPSIQYLNLLVDRNAESALFAKLKSLPTVSAITVKQAAIDGFYDTIAEQMLIFIGVFTVFAATLGFGVAYNSARIALSERSRELATLRVLGFTRREISYILLAELALLILIALPIGCVIGRGLTVLIAHLFDTELFRLPLLISPATYGLAVLFTLVATGVSAWLVRRRVDSLDLIAVLKTRE